MRLEEVVGRAGLVAALMAFSAGFADASTFVGADGVFCAHVTGNFVVLAADLATHAERSEWMKLATFPIFIGTVLVTTFLTKQSKPLAPRTIRRLLAIVGVLICGAASIALAWPGQAARAAIVGLLVAAMGVQNATHRLSPAMGAVTTVMTGNVTSMVVATIVEPDDARKQRTVVVIVTLFTLGCIAGALGVAHVGFATLLVPAAASLAAAAIMPGIR